MVNVHVNYYMRNFRDNKVPYNSQTIIPIPFHSWRDYTLPFPWESRGTQGSYSKSNVWTVRPTSSQQKWFLVQMNGKDCVPYCHLRAEV